MQATYPTVSAQVKEQQIRVADSLRPHELQHSRPPCLSIKSHEVLIYTTIWKNIENIMQNERNQPQKTTIYIIAFI